MRDLRGRHCIVGVGETEYEQRGEPTPDDGIRLVTNLVTPDFQPEPEERVAIGARVEVCFQPIGPERALPQFRLTGVPSASPLWRLPG